jgi:hypothetical protein
MVCGRQSCDDARISTKIYNNFTMRTVTLTVTVGLCQEHWLQLFQAEYNRLKEDLATARAHTDWLK